MIVLTSFTESPINRVLFEPSRGLEIRLELPLQPVRRAGEGAFKVAADRSADITGRRVVLIDDVLTSGATSDACARALLRAKAAQVDVLVFARVVDSHKPPI